MKKGRRTIFTILLTLLVGFIYFYLNLPAINLHDPGFYWFIFIMAAAWCVLRILFSGGLQLLQGGEVNLDLRGILQLIKRTAKVPALICLGLVAVFLVGSLISSPILRARSYAQILPVEHRDFAEDVREIGFGQIPMLDAISAARLGNRTLGELADVVSQFAVADQYTQINLGGRPVRVAPVEYLDIIRWFNNTAQGLPAYIVVDMVTQHAEVVRLEPGSYMRYSPSEYFFRNINRHLRFNYPTFMFADPVFHINDDDVPYWVAPRIVKRIGLFGGRDIEGAVLVNAVTGAHQYYPLEQIPTWVDRVFPAELLIEQYNWYGAYSDGFINSILGQRGVTAATRGYNYIAKNNDVYLYTGITSVGADDSIIGFVLINQRTRDTALYAVAGAVEYAAMASAEGLVQDLRYTATFPLLLNIAGRPTYFVALKDSTDIVRQYAMVDVEFSQIAVNAPITGSPQEAIQEAERLLREALLQQELIHTEAMVGTYVSGVIEEIRHAVIDGTSHFHIRLQGQDVFFVIPVNVDPYVLFFDEGDQAEIYHSPIDGNLVSAYRILRP